MGTSGADLMSGALVPSEGSAPASAEMAFLEQLAEVAAQAVYDDDRGAEFIEHHIAIWDMRRGTESDTLTRGDFPPLPASLPPSLARQRQELVLFCAENELRTWVLLRHLRKVEEIVATEAYAAIRAAPFPAPAAAAFSPARVAEACIQRDPELLRCQAVLDWLE